MSSLNTHPEPVHTHGGAVSGRLRPIEELRRTVCACLLWEDSHYEKGSDTASRIETLAAQVDPEQLAALAIEAKNDMKLRHVPLYLARLLAAKTQGAIVGDTIAAVIRRPDEMSEFLALYWKCGRGTTAKLSAQVKRGLRIAFGRFNEYSLSKWNQGDAIKLRDVLFLCHAKPKDTEQDTLWKRLISGDLVTADTWETALSSGADKKSTWERLLTEQKLGYTALLMNLRNMSHAGVDRALIRQALVSGAGKSRELPFRFLSAAKAAPELEDVIEKGLLAALADTPKLTGRTLLVVDTSGSMSSMISSKSIVSRIDTACALAMLAREKCEEVVIYATAGNDFTRVHATALIPPRRGFGMKAAIEAVMPKIGGGGIFLQQCMEFIQSREKGAFDRVIVFTDEQDCDLKANPATAAKLGRVNYIVNVAHYQNGIDLSAGWKRVSGWSERVLDWIKAEEDMISAEELHQE